LEVGALWQQLAERSLLLLIWGQAVPTPGREAVFGRLKAVLALEHFH
jgi:hypothetical protein